MVVTKPDRLADAQAELETRVRRGRLHTADDLKADFPAVWDDPESRLELVYAEYVFRSANGEQPRREDWFDRYPDLHERLQRLFGLYDLMAGDTHRPAATLGPERATAKPLADEGHPDGYEILGELARGGMAVVCARHQQLNRVVALKVLRWGNWDAADDARRVRREAELVARLQHPNIVQVYEVGEWDGDPFLALEYVAGGTLADALARYQRQGQTGVSTAEAVALVGVLAGAVQAAHEQGVVHRDLKPANVLLADDQDGPFARPKVTDFGLAVSTELSAAIMQTATVAGTPCYMAPEQADARRAAIGPRTDVYALGGILYELLTGRPPFQGATVLETLDLVRHAEPVSPRQLRPNLPRDLETVCLKCLSKDPTRRYDSAAALGDDLARFRDGRPITARPVGVVEKGWKWCRRKPVLAGLAAGLVLAVALGVAGVTREYKRAEVERQNAVAAANGEREANALTAERLKQIERINNAMLDIFAGLDIRRVKANGTSVESELAKKLIETGDQLDANAIRDPLVLAQLRHRLGRTLIGLGEPEAGIKLLTAAHEVFVSRLGPDDPESVGSLGNLATSYRFAGQLAKAVTLSEESVARMKAVLGPDHEDTLTSMVLLADTYREAGQVQKALPLLDEALARMTAKYAPDHRSRINCTSSLGLTYATLGQVDKAVPLFEDALARLRVVLGPDHPDTLTSLSNLAGGYQYSGRKPKAVPLFEEAYTRQRTKLGPDHPSTLTGMRNLAAVYQEVGRVNEAVPLCEEALRLSRAKLGPDHPTTLLCLNTMGFSYRAAGRLTDALPLFEEAVTLCKTKFGPDHQNTLRAMTALGETYRQAGKPDRAVPVVEEALAGSKSTFGPAHPDTLSNLRLLGKVYAEVREGAKAAAVLAEHIAAQRKRLAPDNPNLAGHLATAATDLLKCDQYAAAEQLLRESLAIRETKQPDHWQTFQNRSLLGGALLGQKKYADAEPLLLQGYEGMKTREKAMPQTGGSEVLIPDALNRLIALYTATNKPDEVKKYRELRGGYPTPRPKEKK